MTLRRGIMAQMASGKLRYAEGEMTLESNNASLNIAHNLNSTQILVIAQRINSDHSNVEYSASAYTTFAFFGATKDVVAWDKTQVYVFNGGTGQYFIDTGTGNTWPSGTYSYFSANAGTSPATGSLVKPSAGLEVVDNNTVIMRPSYQCLAGRWVWRAWALD